jgi:hypothetical protein
MTRILLVVQDKGGVGKSLTTRALAEAVPDAPVIEVDANQRLIELKERVSFFPMRAGRAAIDQSGGKAARAEFDGVITAMQKATKPTIIDVGANTSASLMSVLGSLSAALTSLKIQLGVVVLVTAEPGALAEAPRLMMLAKPLAAARFLIENRLHGEVEPKSLAKIADGATVTTLAEHAMEDHAVAVLQAGGLASIPKLDIAKLIDRHGVALGSRVHADLTRLRADTMEAVLPAAKWLVG